MIEIESLITGSRWSMLQVLAEKPATLQEIAQATNTTVANVSAQCKLLEIAQIITKQKLQEREAGRPRVIYSLSNRYSFLARLSEHCLDKQLITLTPLDKVMQAILLLDTKYRQAAYKFCSDNNRHSVSFVGFRAHANNLYVLTQDTLAVASKTINAIKVSCKKAEPNNQGDITI